ncbi:MAG: FFLEELY motif protein [Rhodoferax sp.]
MAAVAAGATIREAVAAVQALRAQTASDPRLAQAVQAVKAFQAQRFRHTYADLLATPRFASAVLFFLDELYGERDYAARDAQFARIASPLERLFPASVVDTAVSMAQLHHSTETLDLAMAEAVLALDAPLDAAGYVRAWERVGQAAQRQFQLDTVLRVGRDLVQFTRKRGLRTLLALMRPAARASGLGALQNFLEAGFDTFGAMSRDGDSAHQFLACIAQREAALLQVLFAGDAGGALAALGQ